MKVVDARVEAEQMAAVRRAGTAALAHFLYSGR
jgi:hypothetical protein